MSHTPSIKINKIHEAWAVENGYRPKGASCKRQAKDASAKRQASSLKSPDTSHKPQATSFKLKAASDKLLYLCPLKKF